MNMAILEHKRELVIPIEVKSKFCSGFIFRIVDIIEVIKETLEKRYYQIPKYRKVH